MAAPIVHTLHAQAPGIVWGSIATIIAVAALWLLVRPLVAGHSHGSRSW